MKKKRRSFPEVVKNGSSRVTIYQETKLSGTYYRVAYYAGGKREFLLFLWKYTLACFFGGGLLVGVSCFFTR